MSFDSNDRLRNQVCERLRCLVLLYASAAYNCRPRRRKKFKLDDRARRSEGRRGNLLKGSLKLRRLIAIRILASALEMCQLKSFMRTARRVLGC
jgi:hypothetical protein